MNERVFYVPFNVLLGYIRTATFSRNETKDDSSRPMLGVMRTHASQWSEVQMGCGVN